LYHEGKYIVEASLERKGKRNADADILQLFRDLQPYVYQLSESWQKIASIQHYVDVVTFCNQINRTREDQTTHGAGVWMKETWMKEERKKSHKLFLFFSWDDLFHADTLFGSSSSCATSKRERVQAH
jgi:hypothetical protein